MQDGRFGSAEANDCWFNVWMRRENPKASPDATEALTISVPDSFYKAFNRTTQSPLAASKDLQCG